MSSIVNKIKDAVKPDRSSSNTTGTVDNDYTGTQGVGNTGTTGAGVGTGPTSNTAGPHKSNLLNKADPRVDSDRDGSRTAGTTGVTGTDYSGTGTGTGYSSGAAGDTGYGGDAGAGYGGAGVGNTGYGSGTEAGYDSTGAGNTGYGSGTGAGYDNTGTGNTGYGGGAGPAPNTAGPHGSDVLNKVDPRVDSDQDGSRRVGGGAGGLGTNQTFQSGTTGRPDPTDAAQVPPSVMRRHVGDPTIAHSDHLHDRDRRNSTATHQETFSGI